MIYHENCLLADNSLEISYLIFFRKLGKMLQNLSSAAFVIGTLRVNIHKVVKWAYLHLRISNVSSYGVRIYRVTMVTRETFTFSFPSAELFALSFNFISLCLVSKIFSLLVSLSNI